MKTVVDIIKECLDKGMTTRWEIETVLRDTFPNEDPYKLLIRIKPTIAYLTRKNLPKSEFAICGTPQKTEQQEMLIKALKIAKEKTDLKIVKFVWRRGGHSYYRPPRTFMNGDLISGNYVKISKNDYRSKDWNLLFGTVLHELVHATGYYGHGPKFYTKLIDAGLKCGLDMDNWFTTEYAFGKRFYAEYRRTKLLDLEILNKGERDER